MTISDETPAILAQAGKPSSQYLEWASSHYSLIQAYRDTLQDVDGMDFLLGRKPTSVAEVRDPGAEEIMEPQLVVPPNIAVEPGTGAPSSLTQPSEAAPESKPDPEQDSGLRAIFDFHALKSGAGSAKTFMSDRRQALSQKLSETAHNSKSLPSFYGSLAGYFVFRPLIKRELRLHVRSVLRTLRVEYRTERTGINPSTVEGRANRELLGQLIADVTEGLEHHTHVAGLPGGQGRVTGFLGGVISLGVPTSLIVTYWGPVQGFFKGLLTAPTDDVLYTDLITLGDQILFIGGLIGSVGIALLIALFVLAQSMAFSVKHELLLGRDAYQMERNIFHDLGRETPKETKLYQWQRAAYVLVLALVGIFSWQVF